MYEDGKSSFFTYHIVMKFPTEACIGEVKGNQVMTKECYFTIVKEKQKVKETFTISLDSLVE